MPSRHEHACANRMNTNNIVTALASKRSRLAERKRNLTESYEQNCRDIDAEIRRINSAIDVVNKAVEPYLCPECHGCGNTRRCDAAGQMEDATCPSCHGTGIREI